MFIIESEFLEPKGVSVTLPVMEWMDADSCAVEGVIKQWKRRWKRNVSASLSGAAKFSASSVSIVAKLTFVTNCI